MDAFKCTFKCDNPAPLNNNVLYCVQLSHLNVRLDCAKIGKKFNCIRVKIVVKGLSIGMVIQGVLF